MIGRNRAGSPPSMYLHRLAGFLSFVLPCACTVFRRMPVCCWGIWQVSAFPMPVLLMSYSRLLASLHLWTVNPNRSLDRPTSIGLSFWGFPSPFALLPASCLPLCLDVARYAFDKGDSQSARQQNEIALGSNDRFGLNQPLYSSCLLRGRDVRLWGHVP